MPDVGNIGATAGDVVSSVDRGLKRGNPVLVLFEEGLDEVHSRFLDDFVRTRSPRDYVLLWRGEFVTSKKEFFDECVHVMPKCASYFGRNLDALDEVLRDHDIGLARNPDDQTFWIWTNAHDLFIHDREFFLKLYAGTVRNAKDVNQREGLGGIGAVPYPPQPVSFLITGLWEPMKEAVLDDDSFLHTTRWWQFRPQPPPEPTGLVTFRVSK